MKGLKSLLFGMVLLSLFLCLSPGTTHAADITYLGEFCATASQAFCVAGAPCVTPVSIKLGILSYGDGHYALNGAAGEIPVHGTGYIQDNIATISLTGTTPTSTYSIHIVWDLSAGTGTYTAMPIFPVVTPPATSGLTLSLTGGFCQ